MSHPLRPLVLGLLFFGILAFPGRLPAAPLALYKVTRTDLEVALTERGSIEAAEAADVVVRVKARGKNSTVAGVIRWVIDDGTQVKQGDKVVELDPSALKVEMRNQRALLAREEAILRKAEKEAELVRAQQRLEVETAEGNLAIAEIDLKEATAAAQRSKQMIRVRLARRVLEVARLAAEFRQAEADAKRLPARNAVELARARLEALKEEIARCVLRAPAEGMAVYYVPEQARFGGGKLTVVAVGEPVREGQKLMRVVGLKKMQVRLRVHEAQVARVRAGQPVQVRVDAFPARRLAGKVQSVATVASAVDWLTADVRVYAVMVALDASNLRLRPGMSAEARILLERRKGVLAVPLVAVRRAGRVTYCYVMKDGLPVRRPIVLGARVSTLAEIKEGLKEGESVVLNPGAVEPPAKKGGAKRLGPMPGPAEVLVRSVRPAEAGKRGVVLRYGLTAKDLEAFRKVVPAVVSALPARIFRADVRVLDRAFNARLVATLPGYAERHGLNSALAGGRFLADADGSMPVVVLGARAAETLFPLADPLGETVSIRGVVFRVVGVLENTGDGMGSQDVYVPLTVANRRFGAVLIRQQGGRRRAEQVDLHEVLLRLANPGQVRVAAAAVTAVLEDRHPQKDWVVEVGR